MTRCGPARPAVSLAIKRGGSRARARLSWTVLKLDYDTRRLPGLGRIRSYLGLVLMRLRRAGYRPLWLMQKRSPSGKGWHVMIEVEPRPRRREEVVALQAILGSDPQREACNLWRARQGGRVGRFWRERFNVLYY